VGKRGASGGAGGPDGEAGATRARRAHAVHDIVAWTGSTVFHSTPVRAQKSPKNLIEVHKVVNRKVVDLTTLYNFYKGSRVFFSTDFVESACQHRMPPCLGEQEVLPVDQVFHPFPIKI
jgi:hypothetical protein